MLTGIFLAVNGCASIHHTFDDYFYKNKIYVGVRADLTFRSPHWYHHWIQLIDLPFSLVMDTVFLPYAILTTNRNLANEKPTNAVCFLMKSVEFHRHPASHHDIFNESEQCSRSSRWGEDEYNTRFAMIPAHQMEALGAFYDAVLYPIEGKRDLRYQDIKDVIVYYLGEGRYINLIKPTEDKKVYEPYPIWVKKAEKAQEVTRVILQLGGKVTREDYSLAEYRSNLWAFEFEDPIGTRYQAIYEK